MMSYFKNRMNTLRDEYKKSDKSSFLAAAGGVCPMPMCRRQTGDEYTFGPTRYLKKRIKFRVTMHVHVIDGAIVGGDKTVMCSGCHMSYHHFNRLSEEAEMGGKQLGKVVYRRCPRCNDLIGKDSKTGERTCNCCEKCSRAPKWCACCVKCHRAPGLCICCKKCRQVPRWCRCRRKESNVKKKKAKKGKVSKKKASKKGKKQAKRSVWG